MCTLGVCGVCDVVVGGKHEFMTLLLVLASVLCFVDYSHFYVYTLKLLLLRTILLLAIAILGVMGKREKGKEREREHKPDTFPFYVSLQKLNASFL